MLRRAHCSGGPDSRPSAPAAPVRSIRASCPPSRPRLPPPGARASPLRIPRRRAGAPGAPRPARATRSSSRSSPACRGSPASPARSSPPATSPPRGPQRLHDRLPDPQRRPLAVRRRCAERRVRARVHRDARTRGAGARRSPGLDAVLPDARRPGRDHRPVHAHGGLVIPMFIGSKLHSLDGTDRGPGAGAVPGRARPGPQRPRRGCSTPTTTSRSRRSARWCGTRSSSSASSAPSRCSAATSSSTATRWRAHRHRGAVRDGPAVAATTRIPPRGVLRLRDPPGAPGAAPDAAVTIGLASSTSTCSSTRRWARWCPRVRPVRSTRRSASTCCPRASSAWRSRPCSSRP